MLFSHDDGQVESLPRTPSFLTSQSTAPQVKSLLCIGAIEVIATPATANGGRGDAGGSANDVDRGSAWDGAGGSGTMQYMGVQGGGAGAWTDDGGLWNEASSISGAGQRNTWVASTNEGLISYCCQCDLWSLFSHLVPMA